MPRRIRWIGLRSVSARCCRCGSAARCRRSCRGSGSTSVDDGVDQPGLLGVGAHVDRARRRRCCRARGSRSCRPASASAAPVGAPSSPPATRLPRPRRLGAARVGDPVAVRRGVDRGDGEGPVLDRHRRQRDLLDVLHALELPDRARPVSGGSSSSRWRRCRPARSPGHARAGRVDRVGRVERRLGRVPLGPCRWSRSRPWRAAAAGGEGPLGAGRRCRRRSRPSRGGTARPRERAADDVPPDRVSRRPRPRRSPIRRCRRPTGRGSSPGRRPVHPPVGPRRRRISALIAGTTSCRSPITAYVALVTIGASGSVLIARMCLGATSSRPSAGSRR